MSVDEFEVYNEKSISNNRRVELLDNVLYFVEILEEERERLFHNSFSHKHMAIAFRMKDEFIKDLPCAVHVDGTARPQFVEEKDNPNYYRYLKALKDITGYGVSLNTSFNLHGRTIVRTPENAVVDFIDCNIDELFIEGYRVKRK